MFINKFELDNSKKYLKNGYLIQKAENFKALDSVRNILVKAITEQIKNNHFKNSDELLNNIHKLVSIKNLNSFRLNVICVAFASILFSNNSLTTEEGL